MPPPTLVPATSRRPEKEKSTRKNNNIYIHILKNKCRRGKKKKNNYRTQRRAICPHKVARLRQEVQAPRPGLKGRLGSRKAAREVGESASAFGLGELGPQPKNYSSVFFLGGGQQKTFLFVWPCLVETIGGPTKALKKSGRGAS